MVFVGESQNSLDSKNRLIIPFRYRDAFGGRCVVTKGFDDCLYVYTIEDYEEFTDKMRKMSKANKKSRTFIRQYTAMAEECKFDTQGRILIPERLKEFAGITKNVVILGVLDKLELWSAEKLSMDNENLLEDEEFTNMLEEFI